MPRSLRYASLTGDFFSGVPACDLEDVPSELADELTKSGLYVEAALDAAVAEDRAAKEAN